MSKTALSPSGVVVFCGFLMSLSAFSIDISLPLFNVMATGIGSPLENMPLTITFYIGFLGLGQLFFGSLSDRYGRRPILVLGMCLFISGAVIASASNSIVMLLIGRAIQGLGAASPYVLSRAIIRDLYEGPELAKKMAIATGLFSVGPLMAPLLGAGLLEMGANWRWVFILMAMYCSGMLWVLRSVPETNQNPDPNATRLSTLAANVVTVLQTRQSRHFIAVNAIVGIAMILIIATAASLYANTFGIVGTAFALYFAVHGLGIIVGQFANHRLIGLIGVVPTTIAATIVMILSSLSISVSALTGYIAPWGVSLCLTLFAVGFLSVVANSTSMVLQSHGNIVGFTAAFLGTISSLFASLMSSIISLFVQQSILAWSLSICAITVVVLALLLRWQTHAFHHTAADPG